MGTNAASGKGHRITFHDGKIRLIVFPLLDMVDILRNIYLSRAGLAAWGQTVSHKVHMKDSVRWLAHLHDPLGTGLLTGPAAHALFHVHDRIALRPDFKGAKEACLHTAAKAQATHSAVLGPCVKQVGSPAVIDAHIGKFLRRSKSACTGVF
jgi:hypothetical protein